jgi:hypothetical protein
MASDKKKRQTELSDEDGELVETHLVSKTKVVPRSSSTLSGFPTVKEGKVKFETAYLRDWNRVTTPPSGAISGSLMMKPSQVDATLRLGGYLVGSTSGSLVCMSADVTPASSPDFTSFQGTFAEMRLNRVTVSLDLAFMQTDTKCNSAIILWDPSYSIIPTTWNDAMSVTTSKWLLPTSAVRAVDFTFRPKTPIFESATVVTAVARDGFVPMTSVSTSDILWGKVTAIQPRSANAAFSCDVIWSFDCTFRVRK